MLGIYGLKIEQSLSFQKEYILHIKDYFCFVLQILHINNCMLLQKYYFSLTQQVAAIVDLRLQVYTCREWYLRIFVAEILFETVEAVICILSPTPTE